MGEADTEGGGKEGTDTQTQGKRHRKEVEPSRRQSEGQRWTETDRARRKRGGRRPEAKIQRGRQRTRGRLNNCSQRPDVGWAWRHNSTGLYPPPQTLQSRQETDKGRAESQGELQGQDWAQTWPGTEHLGSWGSG